MTHLVFYNYSTCTTMYSFEQYKLHVTQQAKVRGLLWKHALRRPRIVQKSISCIGRYLVNCVPALDDDTDQSGERYGVFPIESITSDHTSVIPGITVVFVAHVNGRGPG